MEMKSVKNLSRRATVALYILIAAFLVCIGSLVRVGLIHGEEYKLKAEQNQLLDTKISAERGTIYDSNMNILAKSASAWLVYINPSKITTEEQRTLVTQILCETLGLDEETVTEKTKKQANYVKIAGEVEEEKKVVISDFIKAHSKQKLSTIIGLDPDTKRYYPYSSFASSIIGFVNSDDIGTGGIEKTYNDELTGVRAE